MNNINVAYGKNCSPGARIVAYVLGEVVRSYVQTVGNSEQASGDFVSGFALFISLYREAIGLKFGPEFLATFDKACQMDPVADLGMPTNPHFTDPSATQKPGNA